jgi:hypothetical protein
MLAHRLQQALARDHHHSKTLALYAQYIAPILARVLSLVVALSRAQ